MGICGVKLSNGLICEKETVWDDLCEDHLSEYQDKLYGYSPDASAKTYSEEFVRKLCKEVMELGMSTRIAQIEGYCDQSGKEVLEEFLKDKL